MTDWFFSVKLSSNFDGRSDVTNAQLLLLVYALTRVASLVAGLNPGTAKIF
ncbi:hypothetical protein [Oenococcus sp.]|uniref:hypothetical protein n=1 Tax=Oenococcus sp. TaxID=1979414 RepID=UPI0039ED70DA